MPEVMNYRTWKTLLFFLGAVNFLYAQDRPAPEYLTKQAFPDSVLNTPLNVFNGGQTSFANVLSKYSGRKVVVDFWASWCRDCIIGLPDLNKLMNKTKKDDVVYLFLSVDKEDGKWRNAIDRFKMRGEHYRFDNGWKNPLTNYIDLDWIPRYMVLDETGKIIEPKAIKIQDDALQAAVLNP